MNMWAFFQALAANLYRFTRAAMLSAASLRGGSSDQAGRVEWRKSGWRSQAFSKQNWREAGMVVDAEARRGKW
jgi:hypothetical protein